MSVKRSKRILGLFAVLIMMHHLGQKTSAFWVPATVRQHGLEVFVPIGYLLVSFFFFCSGYGLTKSMRAKEDYFKGFLVKRLNRILFTFLVTEIVWLFARISKEAVWLSLNPYSWFIYTIIILYVGFFLIYRKEGKASFALMALWILGYSVICYILITGNWWYNSAPIFLLGIYMADHEKDFPEEQETGKTQTGRKKNIIKLAVPAVILIAAFIISENGAKIYNLLHMTNYSLINMVIVILQIIAGACFSLIIYYLASMGNRHPGDTIIQKILDFYGGMTLEFYLIHGLFVQAFGHHFINDSIPPVCYIKNVLLYVIVVFAISTACAYIIKKVGDILSNLYGRSEGFRKFCRDQKKIGKIVLIILAVFTVLYGYNRHKSSKEAEPKLEEYKAELTYVTAGGTDVAAYMAGDGDYTVVLLGADDDPCSTLYLRPLADKLTDTYRVVIIDYPGKGYSGESDAERTTEYFADMIHETLEGLDVTDNIIIVPIQLSAIYAYRYIEKYPEGLAGFVGVDAVVPAIAQRFMDGNYSSVDEYRWFMKRMKRYDLIQQKLLITTGYISFQLPVYDYMFYGSGMKEYYPVMEEMHIRRYSQPGHLDEIGNVYDNCMAVEGYKFPADFHAAFLLDNLIRENEYYGLNWENEYNKIISNPDMQSITIVDGNPYVIYYNPAVIAKLIDEFTGQE